MVLEKCNLSLSWKSNPKPHGMRNYLICLFCFKSAENSCALQFAQLSDFIPVLPSGLITCSSILSLFLPQPPPLPPEGVFFSFQLSYCLFFSPSLLRCAVPCIQWRRGWRGLLHACPAEPLSPGVSVTGSQPDGTEQVCSRWPSSLEGQDAQWSPRRRRGMEQGAQQRDKEVIIDSSRGVFKIVILDYPL